MTTKVLGGMGNGFLVNADSIETLDSAIETGAPRSWDELGAELSRIYNRVDQRHLGEEETMSNDVDALRVVAALRALRPVVEASGDQRTIRQFNDAMKAARRLAEEQRTHIVSALDSLPRRTRETELEAANDFEAAVKRARVRLHGEPEPLLPDRPSPFVANTVDTEESFEDRVKLHRRRMRGE